MQTLSLRLAGVMIFLCLAPAAADEPEKVDLRTELLKYEYYSGPPGSNFLDKYYTPEHHQEVTALIAEMMASDPDPSNRLLAYCVSQDIHSRVKKEMLTSLREACESQEHVFLSRVAKAALLSSGDDGVEFIPRLLRDQEHSGKFSIVGAYFSTLSNAKIRELLQHAEPRARQSAMSALLSRAAEHDRNLNTMRELTYGGTPERRAEALVLMAEMESRVPSRDRLVELVDDPDPQIGRCAMECLGQRLPRTLATVMEGLHHKYPEIRRAAVVSLQRMSNASDELVAALIQRIEVDADANVALAAIKGIPQYGVRAAPAVPSIRRRLRECETDDNRATIVFELGRLGPAAKESGPDLRSLVAATSPHLQLGIAEALWKIDPRPEEVVAIVRGVMERPEARGVKSEYAVVKRTQEVAILLGPQASPLVPVLVDYLEYARIHPSEHLARRALWSKAIENTIRTLQAIGPDARDAVPVLQQIAADCNVTPAVNQAAEEAIRAIEAGQE